MGPNLPRTFRTASLCISRTEMSYCTKYNRGNTKKVQNLEEAYFIGRDTDIGNGIFYSEWRNFVFVFELETEVGKIVYFTHRRYIQL